MPLKNNQNVGNLLLFVVNHVGVKMAESVAANAERRFRSPKTWEEESKLLKGSIRKSTAYKTKWGQDFRITPYINYAYIHCLKKTKDRTILSSAIVLEIFNFFSKSFLKRAKFGAF